MTEAGLDGCYLNINLTVKDKAKKAFSFPS